MGFKEFPRPLTNRNGGDKILQTAILFQAIRGAHIYFKVVDGAFHDCSDLIESSTRQNHAGCRETCPTQYFGQGQFQMS